VELPSMLQPLKQSTWPIHFRGVIGQDESVALHSLAGARNSWSNAKEANVVAQVDCQDSAQKGRFDSFDWCHGSFSSPSCACSFDISCEHLISAVSMLVQSRTTKLLKEEMS
jgi:hypothetical protein